MCVKEFGVGLVYKTMTKAKILTICVFLWWAISPFILMQVASSTEFIIGLWLGVGSWLAVYINFKHPGESPLYMMRTMFLLSSIVAVIALIKGII